MDIWYTPERIALHQEIDERRVARWNRRAARVARQERQEHVLGVIRNVIGFLFGFAFLCAYLFFGALWASI